MNSVLKSKVGRTSKTPIDKSVSAERDFNNTDSCKPQNTKPAAEKRVPEQLDVGEVKENPPAYTAEVAEVEKDATSYKHHLNVAGTGQHPTGTQVRMLGNKELANDEKTSDKCVSMTEHSKPRKYAVVFVNSSCSGDFDLESVYSEDTSVFDDDLVFEDVCLDYETSSMTVEMFTDRATSEELLPDGKPQENASRCHDELQAVENVAKLSPKSDAVGVSANSDDETSLSANVVHGVKPAGKRLQQEKQRKVSKARRLVSKKDALKRKIHFPEGNELVKCSGNKKSDVGVESNKHICEATENVENLGPLQLGEMEATESDSVVAYEDLQQRQMSRQSSSSLRQKSSQSRVISRHDVNDDVREQARSNMHSSDTVGSTDTSSNFRLDDTEDAETGSMATDSLLQRCQVSGRSSGSRQVSSQSGILSRHDSSSLSYSRQISETAEGTQNIDPVDLDNVEDVNTGCEAADENLQQHLRENSSSLSNQKASQSGIISRHGSVPLDRALRSSSSCTENTEWHLATMFENTFDSIDAVSLVNDNTTSERGNRSASNLDLPDLFQKSASGEVSNEGKSSTNLSSVRSCSSPGSRPRSVNYQDSSADSDEETKSDVMPSPAQHLHSSDRSSDWHLMSLFNDESESARDTKRSGRESIRSNLSNKSSTCSSEWHIGQLFDDDAYLPSRWLSGDLRAWASRPADVGFLLPYLSCMHQLCYLFDVSALLYSVRYALGAPCSSVHVLINKMCERLITDLILFFSMWMCCITLLLSESSAFLLMHLSEKAVGL